MRIKIKDVLNINLINKMMYDVYQITKSPIAIMDTDGDFVCSHGFKTTCSGIECGYEELRSYCIQEFWTNNNDITNGEVEELNCINGVKILRLPVYIMNTEIANVYFAISNENRERNGIVNEILSFFVNAINLFGDLYTKTLERTDREYAIINNYEEMKVSYNKLISVNSELRFKIWELEQIIQHEKDTANRNIGTEQRKYIMETVRALSAMMETKDKTTARHQRKVAYLACKIAANLKLGKEQCEGVYVSALLHDIGKIGVPLEIIGKADQLSELEFEMVKNHVHMGKAILKEISFPWPVVDIVMQHHEKVDGSGYPYGLKKSEICIEAKIIAVADAVIAITDHRSYRPSLSLAYAMEEIKKHTDDFYDKKVVEACLKIYMNRSMNIVDLDYQTINNMD